MLVVIRCSLLAACGWLLVVVCCLLFVDYCLLHDVVVCRVLFGVCCLMFVYDCRLQFVVCCRALLFVGCSSFVVRRLLALVCNLCMVVC